MKRLILAAVVGLSVALGAGAASAAPINCPGSQVATHDAGDQWDCVNKAGNANQSDKEKNDNHAN